MNIGIFLVAFVVAFIVINQTAGRGSVFGDLLFALILATGASLI